jgi:hypothetical protein
MSTYEGELKRIRAMIEEVQAIRERTCEPKDRSIPRYHALSQAVSALSKAADDMRREVPTGHSNGRQ